MRISIRVQIAVMILVLLVGTLGLCWFLNNTFLEDYYEAEKYKNVQTAFDRLNQAGEDGELETEEFQKKMLEYAYRYSVNIQVIDDNQRIVFGAALNTRELQDKLLRYIFPLPFSDKNETPEPNTVFKILDMRNNTEYIEMFGQLDSGEWFIISTAMQNVQDSVVLSNRFLAYVGFIAILISGVVIWIISMRIARPIRQLAEISERMTHMDFEAKYQGKGALEIAHLGENINKLSETLEKNISELKTANNKLQKDIESKEQIDEMRKEFVSNVSHELKTPIALIQGYAEGLLEGIHEDAESRTFYCEVIRDEADKMNHMVKKLLTLNQLEFGNDVVSMERFDVVMLVRNYLQSAAILIKQNNINVKLHQTQPIYVWADEFKTEEVFMNYFTNAVNHCGGEKIIDIRFEQREGKVRIGVFNTGEQIPEESLEHLWEKFYKVDKARTREYGGTGVGLSIVKAIMESMNQAYGVENYSNGVLFWFELELVKETGNA